jgi:hypothetical protein
MVAGALVAAAVMAGIAGGQRPQADAVIARVTIADPASVQRFVALGLDMLEMREGDDYFILTTDAQVQQLIAAGWAAHADFEQTAMLNRPRLDSHGPSFNGGYRTVPEMRAFLDEQAAQYPNLTQVFTYGKSYLGSDLFGIRLTNRQITGTKPTFFLMAAIHARELSTSELALRLVGYLLSRYGIDGDATWLLDEHQLVIVPVANPDGRALAEQSYYQRKNVDPLGGGSCAILPQVTNQSGVDLNRNSAFKWGTVNTNTEWACGQTYPGPTAASEVETLALQNLVRSFFPVQRGPNDVDAAPITTTGILLTLHSYSNLVLYPWGWTNTPAPNFSGLSMIGSKFAAYNGYTAGEPGPLLYNTSGTTDDWSYGALGIPSFTFEVGLSYNIGSDNCGGFFPDYSCLDGGAGGSFWPLNLPAFLYAARIARAPYQLALGPSPEAITATVVMTDHISLQALLNKEHNGGQLISAAEYYVDVPPWRGGSAHPLAALDGAFDNQVEVATAVGGPLLPGRHLLFVRGLDVAGNWGPVRAAFVSVPLRTVWIPFIAR